LARATTKAVLRPARLSDTTTMAVFQQTTRRTTMPDLPEFRDDDMRAWTAGTVWPDAKELSPRGLRLYAFQKSIRARAFHEARGFVARRFSDGADNEEKEWGVLYQWPGEA
jgi:hypothetical protein